jgi:cobalt-zinc-cadmium resistance protein CzcA
MLDNILHFSIRNKLLVGLFTTLLVLVGSWSLMRLPIDAVPDITNNQVQVITYAPSQSAQEIERLVTFPLEQGLVTIPQVEELRSFSRFGLSVITIVFEEDVDVYWARQQVAERLQKVQSQIPQGLGTPELAPLSTGLGEIYQYTLKVAKDQQDTYSLMDLRTLQDWVIRRQLLGIAGLADVSSFGGYVKQYEIALDPEKLRSFSLSIPEIFSALEKNNQNTGGAYIDKRPSAWFIRTEGLLENTQEIENILVRNNENGTPLLIKDVAEVNFGHATRYGAMTYQDQGEAVGGIVLMMKGANAAEVIEKVSARIAEISKTLPIGISIEPFIDRADLVKNVIKTVAKNLAEGALIVIFVLVLMLGNWRAGLVVASVIPLAMLFAVAMMHAFGISGNLMSLGAIDFGLLVDGAVIIVEAVVHHLENRKSKLKLSQKEMDDTVYEAASQMRSSATFGEAIILLVYLPILTLYGVEGKMFKPMAQTVSFAILGAFVLSLTYVPMMSALFLSKNPPKEHNKADLALQFIYKYFDKIFLRALKHSKKVIAIAFALLILSFWQFSRLGGAFIPTLEEGDFAVEMRLMTGSSMQETIETAGKSARVLMQNFPEVLSVVGKIGSSEIPTDPMPMEACDLIVVLKPKTAWTSASDRETLAEKMQERLEDEVLGASFGFQQPIQMRFNELMSGARQDIVVKIFGEDLEKLTAYGEKIAKLASKIDGVKDLYVEQLVGLPEIVVRYKRDALAVFGMDIAEVNQTLAMAFAGQSAGLVYEHEKRFDLVVRLKKENRTSLEDIKNLYITSDTGKPIPLGQIAEVRMENGLNQIQREGAQRRMIVGFNVRERDIKSVVEELQTAVNQSIKLETAYRLEYSGTFENLEAAQKRLMLAVPLALFLIFMLLYFSFNSVAQSLLIFSAIPFSAIGGIWALSLRDLPFSISAGVGFIALFGVAVLNGLVLMGAFNRIAEKEPVLPVQKRIEQGVQTRFRPVLMTAMVASLGFFPMAFSSSAGGEVQKPLATVVIGGLLSATLLTLLVLPCMYQLYIDYQNKKSS